MVVEYGVLFEHESLDVHGNLVGPTFDDVSGATDDLIQARRHGFRGVIVQREDDGPWTELHTGVEAAAWVWTSTGTAEA